jgi:chromatin remodeling complex protein RSC6
MSDLQNVHDMQNGNDDINELDLLMNDFSQIIGSIGKFKIQMTELQNQIRHLERNTKRKMKTLQKQVAKHKKRKKKEPSGFAKPSVVSDELCAFMNKPTGTKMARTEVTRYIIAYIKTNGLQDTANKKHINPDESLANLLGLNVNSDCDVDDNDNEDKVVDNKEALTFFNLQKHMNKHFVL